MYGVPVPTPRDPTPSPDDVAVTRALVQAGKLLDVEVLDHLVIGQGRWVSLKERGLGCAVKRQGGFPAKAGLSKEGKR